ncbi:MAG TPA: efflux RND transporter periplasmic adaptor subunit [Opitutaceae bacterium]|nr:efflux RND transporter periplasmic adaptor subunit [Opitutaceae bacterium]
MKPVLAVLALLIGAVAPVAIAAADASTPVVRAQLVARNSALLSSELGAKVRRIHLVEGAAFKKGDPLITLDDDLPKSQLDRAEAVLTAARRAYATNEKLRQLNSVGQIELDQSKAEVAKAEAELAYAKAIFAKCQILAPFSGRVAEIRIHEQEYMQAGQAMIDLIDDATPEIDFIAPSKWLAWLRVGGAMDVTIDENGRTYSATVERIGARVDPVSQSVKVVAALSQPAPELVAGMSGSIGINPPQ